MSARIFPLLYTTAAISIVSGCGISSNKPADPDASNPNAAAPVLTDVELAAQEQEWQEFLKTRRDVIARLNAAAAQPGFKEAVALVQQETGAAAMPYVSYEQAEETVAGAMLFDVPYDEQNGLVKRLFEPVKAKGCYVFRVENNFGLDGARDQIGVAATTNCYDVISLQAVSTNGEMSTAGVIRWLKDLEQREPFRITGCGVDFIEGEFLTPIDEPDKLAAQMYEFCPDIVDQGLEDVAALARELKSKRTLYFWWD
jgi:hypothetical protein